MQAVTTVTGIVNDETESRNEHVSQYAMNDYDFKIHNTIMASLYTEFTTKTNALKKQHVLVLIWKIIFFLISIFNTFVTFTLIPVAIDI